MKPYSFYDFLEARTKSPSVDDAVEELRLRFTNPVVLQSVVEMMLNNGLLGYVKSNDFNFTLKELYKKAHGKKEDEFILSMMAPHPDERQATAMSGPNTELEKILKPSKKITLPPNTRVTVDEVDDGKLIVSIDWETSQLLNTKTLTYHGNKADFTIRFDYQKMWWVVHMQPLYEASQGSFADLATIIIKSEANASIDWFFKGELDKLDKAIITSVGFDNPSYYTSMYERVFQNFRKLFNVKKFKNLIIKTMETNPSMSPEEAIEKSFTSYLNTLIKILRNKYSGEA